MSTNVVERIIQKFGTQERLAEAAKTTQSVVAGWKRRGVVPARQQPIVLQAALDLGIEFSPADFFDLPQKASEQVGAPAE